MKELDILEKTFWKLDEWWTEECSKNIPDEYLIEIIKKCIHEVLDLIEEAIER